MLPTDNGPKEMSAQHGASVDLNTAIFRNDDAAVRALLGRDAGLATLATRPDELLGDAMGMKNRMAFDLLLSDTRRPNALQLCQSQPEPLLFRAITQAINQQDTYYLQKLLDAGLPTSVTNVWGEQPLQALAKFSSGEPPKPTRGRFLANFSHVDPV